MLWLFIHLRPVSLQVFPGCCGHEESMKPGEIFLHMALPQQSAPKRVDASKNLDFLSSWQDVVSMSYAVTACERGALDTIPLHSLRNIPSIRTLRPLEFKAYSLIKARGIGLSGRIVHRRQPPDRVRINRRPSGKVPLADVLELIEVTAYSALSAARARARIVGQLLLQSPAHRSAQL